MSKKERHKLLSDLRMERRRRFADRIKVILLLDQGKTANQIAEFLFLDKSSVSHYKRRYEEGGIEELLNDHYVGRSSFLNEEQKEDLKTELESRIYPTTQSIIDYVRIEFGVIYKVGGMTSLLHQLGFSYKKPKGIPGKLDPAKQQRFIKRYTAVKSHGPVYFGDSTHPMLNPILSSGWIKAGTDFKVKTNSGRQRVNINGAIEINSLDVISRSCQTVDKYSICELLRRIRTRNPDEKHLYLVLDNAGYNRSKLVKKMARRLSIKILYLPPYSPNLNPIERLWKFMKKKIMAHKYFPDLETFRKKIMLFMRGIRKYKEELSTLINDNFQIIGA